MQDVEEGLRRQLAEWQTADGLSRPPEVDEVINGLAESSAMEPEAVRMLWLSVARQARPVGAPPHRYVSLAKQLHGMEVDVVDLGQYSAEHSNSCMFLTCAASVAERYTEGHADAELPGALGAALAASGLGAKEICSVDDLVLQHRTSRSSTLGRMADALRHAACEVLEFDQDFYLPFFHPVRARGSVGVPLVPRDPAEEYRRWVTRLRGDEEGDELVVLALARLCALAIQPVQQSGYRVPLMDPTAAAESGRIAFWGNDDHHWVWLRRVRG